MKKLLVILFMVFALVGTTQAFTGAVSSGEQTSDGAVMSVSGWITAIHIITDGTNAAGVVVFDNTAASGKVICEISVAGTDNYGGRTWPFPIWVNNGIYVNVTGTGASYIVEYIQNR